MDSPPVELLAAVFSLLDIQSVVRVRGVCKAWKRVAEDDDVLRLVCLRQGYIVPPAFCLRDLMQPTQLACVSHAEAECDGQHLSRLAQEGRGSDLATYETFLKSSHLLKRSMPFGSPLDQLGRCPAIVKRYDLQMGAKCSPWNAVVDHVDHCLITTPSWSGPIIVTCLLTGETLHVIEGVEHHPYILASEGWLIWFQNGGGVFHPLRFERLNKGQHKPRRGHLQEMKTIDVGSLGHCCKFLFPYLMLGTRKAGVLVFNVPEASQLYRIPLSLPRYWEVHSIDFDDHNVFVLSGSPTRVDDRITRILSVYSRITHELLWSKDLEALFASCRRHRLRAPSRINDEMNTSREFGWCRPMVSEADHEPTAHYSQNAYSIIHHDVKTGTLCVQSIMRYLFIPGYSAYFGTSSAQSKRQPIVIEGPEDPGKARYSTLAVSNGTAAYNTSDYIVVIDLQGLLQQGNTLADSCLLWGRRRQESTESEAHRDFTEGSVMHLSATSIAFLQIYDRFRYTAEGGFIQRVMMLDLAASANAALLTNVTDEEKAQIFDLGTDSDSLPSWLEPPETSGASQHV